MELNIMNIQGKKVIFIFFYSLLMFFPPDYDFCTVSSNWCFTSILNDYISNAAKA